MNKVEGFLEAKELIDDEYYLDALKILKKLQKSNSDSRTVKYTLAQAWVQSGISIERGEKYFQKLINGKDSVATLSKISLGKLKLCRNELDKARVYFDSIDKNDKKRGYALSELVYLNIREENFLQAEEYFNAAIEEKNFIWAPMILSQLQIYLNYKLGRSIDNETIKNYYYGLQLIDYSDERALEHIKLHKDELEGKPKHSLFFDSVDIDGLFYSTKEHITSINPFFVGSVDKYKVCIGNDIGSIHGEEVDCINVVTMPNSNNILSIYPTYNPKKRVKK